MKYCKIGKNVERIDIKNNIPDYVHYPVAETSIEQLQHFGKSASEFLHQYYRYDDRKIYLAGTGTSGGILMTMIAAYYTYGPIGIVTVRKENEPSHAGRISGLNYSDRHKIVIVMVDDFISTGKTIYNLGRSIIQYACEDLPIEGLILAADSKAQRQSEFFCSGVDRLPETLKFITGYPRP